MAGNWRVLVPCALAEEGHHRITVVVKDEELQHISTPCDEAEADAIHRLGGEMVCTDIIRTLKAHLNGSLALTDLETPEIWAHRQDHISDANLDDLLGTWFQNTWRPVRDAAARKRTNRTLRNSGSAYPRIQLLNESLTARIRRHGWPNARVRARAGGIDALFQHQDTDILDIHVDGGERATMWYRFGKAHADAEVETSFWYHMGGMGSNTFQAALSEVFPARALEGYARLWKKWAPRRRGVLEDDDEDDHQAIHAMIDAGINAVV